jgi:UDP-N-acetyl-D-galactosamine dehydrogenase
VIIVAVPTPVDEAKRPDLSYIQNASKIIGKNLQKGALVIYESTVYPGVTEEICLPILEHESGLKLGEFDLGYSPERINPGDEFHRLDNVIKIVSGYSPACLERVAKLYELIVHAGVYRAPSIKVAEAAKITENVQRDVNIALMNELSMIYHRLGIDTKEVLDAAGTKWNFHKYHPGLVGGHCIGLDPYYLAFQATQKGYHPKLILSCREINDYMARHIAELCIKELNKKGKILKDSTVFLLGLTFKEDVNDFRNSRAKDVIQHLKEYGITVFGCEPYMNDAAIKEHYGIEPIPVSAIQPCDAIIIINKHRQFNSIKIENLHCSILLDIKHLFSQKDAEEMGITYVSL